MAISVDQESTHTTADNAASASSSSTDWTNDIGSGKTIILAVYGFDIDVTGLTFTATWSAGGDFTEATTSLQSTSNERRRASCFYLHNAAGSGTKPTVTVTPSQAAFFSFAMLEVDGLADDVEEAENTNLSNTTTTTATPGAISTTSDEVLVVQVIVCADGGNPQAHTPDTGYDEFCEEVNNNDHQGGSAAWQIFDTTLSSHNPPWTITNSRYAATITAFAAAVGGGEIAHLSTDGGWVF